jgi:hypothetical protein
MHKLLVHFSWKFDRVFIRVAAQKSNIHKQKENMRSFSLPNANTIDAPHTHIFVLETVTSNCAATQWCVCGPIIGHLTAWHDVFIQNSTAQKSGKPRQKRRGCKHVKSISVFMTFQWTVQVQIKIKAIKVDSLTRFLAHGYHKFHRNRHYSGSQYYRLCWDGHFPFCLYGNAIMQMWKLLTLCCGLRSD